MKAISLLSLFVALVSTGVSLAAGYDYGTHGFTGATGGRYGVGDSSQSELAGLVSLANSCGFPLNIDQNAFAAPPQVNPIPPAIPGALGTGGLGALPQLPASEQPGIFTGSADNGAPTVAGAESEGGTGTGTGTGGGDTGGDTGGGDDGGSDEQSATDRTAFQPQVESIVTSTCLTCHGPTSTKATPRSGAALLAALESRGSELANKMKGFGANLSDADVDSIRNFAGK